MTERTAQPEEKKKRKGTALLAVMDENCSSCAGSPLCELHCPVENCINLLYEETPAGGLKPYRVWVDNDKCIGCQMCFSDDLTKIHRHKETGEIFREYAELTAGFPLDLRDYHIGGLTKMLAAIESALRCASATSAMCPA